jgi:RimJ/RimL family protein N-acetyltransferase
MSAEPETFTLETQRLVIRPLASDDLPAVQAIKDDAFGEEPLERHREWLDWSIRNYTALSRLYQPPYGDRAVVLKSTQELIGLVGLVPAMGPFDTLPFFRARSSVSPSGLFTTEMGLFWALGPAHHGQGYATEAAQALITYAFEHLSMLRMVATTEYDNYASAAVMQRLGMYVEHNPSPTPGWFQVIGILENPALRYP